MGSFFPVRQPHARIPGIPRAHRMRSVDGPGLLETFLVSAVVSFLSIRGFLALTGYPRLGGNGLHIAHMLWGGLLMLVALGMLLLFLDRWLQWVAAIVAGLGFGTFIDEIGKFLTSNNNYFFRPAVALIYVVFVAVFLVGRAAAGRRTLSPRERLANALDLVAGHVDRPIQPDDRARILALLDGVPDGELASDLRRYVENLPSTPDRWASFESLPSRLARAYARLASREWFEMALIAGVLAYTAAAVVGVVAVLVATASSAHGQTGTVAQVGEAGRRSQASCSSCEPFPPSPPRVPRRTTGCSAACSCGSSSPRSSCSTRPSSRGWAASPWTSSRTCRSGSRSRGRNGARPGGRPPAAVGSGRQRAGPHKRQRMRRRDRRTGRARGPGQEDRNGGDDRGGRDPAPRAQ
ncbi:MAG: hypothetical protein M0Z49_04835, partial [Chloroflexi bacterium]|nr:hypothetical protein [Chloroflexota bacterium]